MSDKRIQKSVLTALFAALTCVATMIIRIPTPGTSGYVHPGDAIVILSGVLLGPGAGFLAAGIGSALSDLIGGYLIYAPVTFFVKGLIALFTGMVFAKIGKDKKKKLLAIVFGGLIDMLLVLLGYGIFEIILYGFAGAAASALPNLVQGAVGLGLALVLYPLLSTVSRQES